MNILLSLIAMTAALGAEPAWVDRHLNCYRGVNRELALPSLRVTNFVYDEPAFTTAWGGELMAVPGTEGDRAGLFLLGNGRAYFVELPRPTGEEPTTREFYARLYTSGNEYAFTARFPDGQPDVRLYVTLTMPVVRIEIATEPAAGFALVHAEPAVEPDLEAQSADVLVRILAHNAARAGDLDRHGREAVRRCKRTLNLQNRYDQRIESLTKRLLPRSG